jgi:hypothetical protein
MYIQVPMSYICTQFFMNFLYVLCKKLTKKCLVHNQDGAPKCLFTGDTKIIFAKNSRMNHRNVHSSIFLMFENMFLNNGFI